MYYLNVDHENHFLMNAPEVSEQQLSKHDRQDGDRAIECMTEINDSRVRERQSGPFHAILDIPSKQCMPPKPIDNRDTHPFIPSYEIPADACTLRTKQTVVAG